MDSRGLHEVRWGVARPLCALCAGEGGDDVAEHHLSHGISVQLCVEHRSDRFLRSNGGHDVVDALTGLWRAAGCLTARRRAALDCHLRRMARSMAPRRHLPGSYSWPVLRMEAEERYAAGEAPQRVIQELRRAYAGGDALVPSVRTMRRWYTEARWCEPAPAGVPRRGVDLVFARVDGLRRHGEPFSWAVTGWPRTDKHGRPYRRR